MIESITLTSVDNVGLNFEVIGDWKDKPFHINLSIECDGRDIESESVIDGGYDPVTDEEDTDFFDALCMDERFERLNNAGYACWELFPSDPTGEEDEE